ncbi:MAG: tRNA (guanosine(37)-N1)-methyltransferase TrmD [Deltaproteobacteria bacterium]|nr:tRNA (guanosine(37)-N1)-methyltransferase TrmD [Deltaproteobacteria bacterium]
MRFDVLTIVPEYFSSPLCQSVLGKAAAKGLLDVRAHNIRDYALDKHKTTDDYPYGGGCGMVMKVEPAALAIEAVKGGERSGQKVILMTPQGRPLSHALAKELSGNGRIIIVCGRYEGVDERIRTFVDMEVSIGDYILPGGEAAALVLIESVARFIPGVLGKDESAAEDSFAEGLLEYPHYTRPEEFRGAKVPQALLSGNHAEIEAWRRRESLRRTYLRRPELINRAPLTENDRAYLKEIEFEKTEASQENR